MPKCPTQEKLAAFVERACPDEENRRLRAHIEICPACAAWLRKVASNERMVNGFERSPETLEISEDAHGAAPKWKRPLPIFEADEVIRELHRGGQGIV